MTSIFLDIRLSLVFFWKLENVREMKNKQIRIINFVGLDNMENSKGKKNGFIRLFNLPHFLTCSFDSGFALDHLCSYVLFCFIYF